MAGPPETGKMLPLSLELASTPEEVRRSLKDLTQALGGHGYRSEFCGIVELVLAEALNNVVEHAYLHRPDGRIEVDLAAAADRMDLTILDQGREMPDGCLPPGQAVEVGVSGPDLPEGGFGWFLIRKLADRLVYERCDGQNRLEIGVPLPGPGLSRH